jgi:hypothetical protein
VAPPPPAAETQGGLAGVRKAAEPISYAADGSTAVHGNPAAAAPTAAAGMGGLDQVADLGSVGEMAAAGDMDGNTAAVSTHSGPEADPYHLGGGST